MSYKKGMYRGTKNMNSHLTEAQVRVIKGELAKGIPASHLARVYVISAESIRRIGRGETWGWLDVAVEEPPLPEPPAGRDLAAEAEASLKRFEERFGVKGDGDGKKD